MFEIMTNEFQSDGVSSSSVYPCIVSIKASKLVFKFGWICLHSATTKRFTFEFKINVLIIDIEKDCFKLATFLDPRMGWKMFNQSKRDMALLDKSLVKVLSEE